MIRNSDEIQNALKLVGFKSGQTVLIHADLAKLGPIENVRQKKDFVDFHFKAISSYLDLKQSTIFVPVFTYSFARTGVPFNRQGSPSEVCMFSEHVRQQPEAYRSLHPLNSFAAIGPKREFLCKDVSRSCWGYNSVFEHFLKLENTEILFYGASLIEFTLMFYCEHLFGVSHCYHKAYQGKVIDAGREIEGPFFAFVRYLGGKVSHDFHRFAQRICEKSLVSKQPLGKGEVYRINAQAAFIEGMKCLEEDPCFFLKEPYFVTT